MQYIYPRPSGRFQVQVRHNGRRLTLGTKDTLEEAKKLLDEYLNEAVDAEAETLARIKIATEEGKLEDTRVAREIRRAAEKWYNAEDNIIEAVKDAIGYDRSLNPVRGIAKIHRNKPGRSARLVVASTSDLHYGKYVSDGQGNAIYNRMIAHEMLMSSTFLLQSEIGEGFVQDAILIIGPDDLHVGTYEGATTRGTPQDMDGTPDDIISGYIPMVINWINEWKAFLPKDGIVYVLFIPGNHNRVLGHALAIAIEHYYKKTSNIIVNASPDPQKYVKYERNLLGFAHGDAKGKKPHDYYADMSIQAKEHWGSTDTRYYFVGHEHHNEVKDAGGITIFRSPTIAPPDRWHKNNLYTTSQLGATAYVFTESGSFAHFFVKK